MTNITKKPIVLIVDEVGRSRNSLGYMLFRLEMEKGQALKKKRDELHGLLSKVLLEIEGKLQELENDAEVQALRQRRETPGDSTGCRRRTAPNTSSRSSCF